ncbi:hypothetical protein DFH29DRAFT_639698 [Suillus ampliporus]|nr:hypothetical protein DFH29DRAFT_639698 [Suillus ampliporus]
MYSDLGTEHTDTVTLGSGLTITAQSIGVASTSTGFAGVDGIIGIGPLDLTEGALTNEPGTTIPTVTQNLYTQGEISQIVVSVSFEPTTSMPDTNGELTFGGTDATAVAVHVHVHHCVFAILFVHVFVDSMMVLQQCTPGLFDDFGISYLACMSDHSCSRTAPVRVPRHGLLNQHVSAVQIDATSTHQLHDGFRVVRFTHVSIASKQEHRAELIHPYIARFGRKSAGW